MTIIVVRRTFKERAIKQNRVGGKLGEVNALHIDKEKSIITL